MGTTVQGIAAVAHDGSDEIPKVRLAGDEAVAEAEPIHSFGCAVPLFNFGAACDSD